jgi:uncharacterized protein YpmS
MTVSIYKKGDKLNYFIIMEYHSYQLHTRSYSVSLSEREVHIEECMKLFGIGFRRNKSITAQIF